jgi:hypothetical protein
MGEGDAEKLSYGGHKSWEMERTIGGELDGFCFLLIFFRFV